MAQYYSETTDGSKRLSVELRDAELRVVTRRER